MGVVKNISLCAFILHTLLTCLTYCQDGCDPITGPERQMCVLVPGYDDYQLAKCMRNYDILSNTSGQFQCKDSCRDFCWLPCMIEESGIERGVVNSSCECQNDTSWCNTETGSCEFFPTCMAPRYDCDGTYSLLIAKELCNHATNIITRNFDFPLSPSCGDTVWLREHRVCVQREIIASVFPNDALTCPDLGTRLSAILESCSASACSSLSGDVRRLFAGPLSPEYPLYDVINECPQESP